MCRYLREIAAASGGEIVKLYAFSQSELDKKVQQTKKEAEEKGKSVIIGENSFSIENSHGKEDFSMELVICPP